jgi:hypothetical protein
VTLLFIEVYQVTIKDWIFDKNFTTAALFISAPLLKAYVNDIGHFQFRRK